MENKKSSEYLKYSFTEPEKAEIAIEMAQKVAEVNQAESQLKAVKSQYTGKINILQAELNLAAEKLNTGYEMRSVKCEVVPNWEEKIWEYVRLDTGEFVRAEEMSVEDLQMRLDEAA